MTSILLITGLLVTAAATALYIAINICIALIIAYPSICIPRIIFTAKRTYKKQMHRFSYRWTSALCLAQLQTADITSRRITSITIANLILTGWLAWIVKTPTEILWLCIALFLYIMWVISSALSILEKIPFLRKIWNDPIRKISAIIFPIITWFIARGIAGMWLSEIFGIDASNMPATHFLAATFILAIIAAAMLVFMMLTSMLLLLAASLIPSINYPSKKISLNVIFFLGSYYLITQVAAHLASGLPSSRIANPILSATLHSFDASSASTCNLTPNEMSESRGFTPELKALFLSSSQEKAVLLRRSPDLLEPTIFNKMAKNDTTKRGITIVRTAECFQTENLLFKK